VPLSFKTEGSPLRRHHEIEGFLGTPNGGGLAALWSRRPPNRSSNPQSANVNLSEFFIVFQCSLKDFPTPSLENRSRDASKDARSLKQAPCQSTRSVGRGTDGKICKASDEMRRELVEPKDIKAHLLKHYIKTCCPLQTEPTQNSTRRGSFQTNVAQNFANWRNFASQSLVKF
jgi:hypothetical protein